MSQELAVSELMVCPAALKLRRLHHRVDGVVDAGEQARVPLTQSDHPKVYQQTVQWNAGDERNEGMAGCSDGEARARVHNSGCVCVEHSSVVPEQVPVDWGGGGRSTVDGRRSTVDGQGKIPRVSPAADSTGWTSRSPEMYGDALLESLTKPPATPTARDPRAWHLPESPCASSPCC